MPPESENRNTTSSFVSFFKDWLVRQEHYLDELLTAQNESSKHKNNVKLDDTNELISRVLTHYQQYYEAKAIAARNDVYLVFSPTWFSSFERTFFWIGGFKPGLAFKIVFNAVTDLNEEKKEQLESLKTNTKAMERELEEQMASLQESVAAPPLLNLARRGGRLVDGERDEMDCVLENLRSSMEVLLEKADSLRVTTTRKVIEILEPNQAVRFLTAAAQLQLRIKAWGKERTP